MKTLKNKLMAIALAVTGYASMLITSDATAFIFLALVAVGLFVEKEDVIR